MYKWYAEIAGFYDQCTIIFEILWFDFDILIQRIKPAIHKYISLGQKVMYLLIYPNNITYFPMENYNHSLMQR